MTDFNNILIKAKSCFSLIGVVCSCFIIFMIVRDVVNLLDSSENISSNVIDYDIISQSSRVHSKALAESHKDEFVIDSAIIEESVENVSSLSVIKKTYVEEVSYEGNKTGSFFGKEFDVPLTKKYVTLGMDVYVNAGVDLTRIKASDIVVDDMTVTINLPRAEFLDVYADSKSIVIAEESDNVLNQISASDIAVEMVEAEELARTDAYKDRVLDDAEERAEELIIDAIKAVYPDEDINVVIVWESME